MKILYIIFSIFYKWYDNKWDEPVIRSILSMSLLLASLINLVKAILYFYTGLPYLKLNMILLLSITGIIFWLIYMHKKEFLAFKEQPLSKRDKIIGWIIIILLLLNWNYVAYLYGIAEAKYK